MRQRGDVHLCSFCGASDKDVAKLIAGPDVNICDVCVDSFYVKLVTPTEEGTEQVEKSTSLQAVCSFCGKRRDEVNMLAGEHVHKICDECISLCAEIVDENDARSNRPSRNRAVSPEYIWGNIEHIAKTRISSKVAFFIYVRLAVDSSKQEEFVKTWRRGLSAALILDGAKAVSYVYGGASGSKARWAVMAHHNSRCHELGEATKIVVDKMHEAGILLRQATWFFLDGACHSV